MAARNCPECNGLVASTINVCPHCGYKFIAATPYADSQSKAPQRRNPYSSLLYPILAVIFGWPFAIASFIYYFKSEQAWSNGDKDAAKSYADSSRTWGMIPVYISLALLIIWAIWTICVINIIM